ncbi:hypothetical protein HK096_004081 [Nowakowskiella sp. JEL0078]|nr:hypothetical protein HK096_004081 [Nowakowskiella sp. JEL0078]
MGNGVAFTTKKKRVNIPLSQKLSAVATLQADAGSTRELVASLALTLNVCPTTVSYWQKKYSFSPSTRALENQTLAQRGKFPILEHVLYMWMSYASMGWLTNFKKRYSVKLKHIHGESALVNLHDILIAQTKYKELLSKWKLEDIFKADETGLFYNAGPTATFTTGTAKGKKKKEMA